MTVFEGCAAVEVDGFGNGELTEGEGVVTDPAGNYWAPVVDPCTLTKPKMIAATAAAAAIGASPFLHRCGGAASPKLAALGGCSAGPWLSRQRCPAS